MTHSKNSNNNNNNTKKKEVQFKGLEKLQTEKKRKEKHSTSFPASTQYLYS